MGSLFPKKRSHHTAKHSNHKIHWWPNMKKKDVVITPAKSEKPENHANFQKESFGAGFSILNFGSVTLLKMSHWIKKFPGYDNSPPTPTEFHVSSALAETNKLPTRKKKTKTPRNWVLFFDQILIEMLVLKNKNTHTLGLNNFSLGKSSLQIATSPNAKSGKTTLKLQCGNFSVH